MRHWTDSVFVRTLSCCVKYCLHNAAQKRVLCVGAWPEHHCKVAEGALLNETIPKEEDGSYSKCLMYVTNDTNETTKCTEWQYFGDVGHTIVSEVITIRCCCNL